MAPHFWDLEASAEVAPLHSRKLLEEGGKEGL